VWSTSFSQGLHGAVDHGPSLVSAQFRSELVLTIAGRDLCDRDSLVTAAEGLAAGAPHAQ